MTRDNYSEGLIQAQERELDFGPEPDIAVCGECGWRGPVADCPQDVDQDGYEAPPYDEGYIEDYDMSPERLVEYNTWWENTFAGRKALAEAKEK